MVRNRMMINYARIDVLLHVPDTQMVGAVGIHVKSVQTSWTMGATVSLPHHPKIFPFRCKIVNKMCSKQSGDIRGRSTS